MKKTIASIIVAVLLIFAVLLPPSIGEITGNDKYSDHDIAQIKAFLNQGSIDPGTPNFEQLGYNADDPVTWTGVNWIENAGEKHVQNILWSNRSLAGSLNLSGCAALQGLVCSNNELNSLDVSGVTALNSIDCSNNKLILLNVGNCCNLKTLKCGGNLLDRLDLGTDTAIESFDCSGNRLKELGAVIKGGAVKLSTEGSGYVSMRLESETLTASETEGLSSLFLNWIDAEGIVVTTDKTYSLNIGESYDLKANYAATVTFDPQGGSEAAPITATEGSYVSSPPAPVKEGYTFAGWYTGLNDLTAISFPHKLMGDVTLYAKWQYNCACLKGIDITQGAKITPAFSSETYDYTVLLDEYTESVTITPHKENDIAVMKIEDAAQPGVTVSIGNGAQQTIKVRVEYEQSIKTYTIIIERAESTNNYLKTLASSNAPLLPAFNKDISLYTVELPEDVDSTTITALAESPALSKIYLNDKTYKLDPGEYARSVVKVESQDEELRNYYIIIHRASSAGEELIKRGEYYAADSAAYKEVILNPAAYSKWAAAINRLQEALPDKRIIVLTAPSSFAFYAPDEYHNTRNDQESGIRSFYSQLGGNIYAVDAYSYLEKNKDDYIYFRTDHHWTVRGAYCGYVAFCEKLGITPVSLDDMQHHYLFIDFLGTYYYRFENTGKAKSLRNLPDIIEYFIPPAMGPDIYGQETAYKNTSMKNGEQSPMLILQIPNHHMFLGGDLPCIKITTGTKNGRSILLFKDSFANTFTIYLVSHYENIYLVDFRDYNKEGKPRFKIIKFINDNNIDDVLLLLSFNMASSSYKINLYNKALP